MTPTPRTARSILWAHLAKFPALDTSMRLIGQQLDAIEAEAATPEPGRCPERCLGRLGHEGFHQTSDYSAIRAEAQAAAPDALRAALKELVTWTVAWGHSFPCDERMGEPDYAECSCGVDPMLDRANDALRLAPAAPASGLRETLKEVRGVVFRAKQLAATPGRRSEAQTWLGDALNRCSAALAAAPATLPADDTRIVWKRDHGMVIVHSTGDEEPQSLEIPAWAVRTIFEVAGKDPEKEARKVSAFINAHTGLDVERLARASMIAEGSRLIDGRVPVLHQERAAAIAAAYDAERQGER